MLREGLLMGACMFALYDLIRILRRLIPHGILWISAEDLVYVVAAALWFFLRVCKVNSGIIRFYFILAMGIGALAYYLILGRPLISHISILILRLKKGLKKLRKTVTIKLVRLKKHKEDGL
ncbi:MAG: spore cortex biosynthesis protein YabQ [Agathobacter sp.]|nr:spore cortex biosynthesis protein YabQ [Agathobacter sp.]